MSEQHKFRELRDDGEFIETDFIHLDLPDNLESPKINGVERTMNLGVTRAPGWHYEPGSFLFIPSYKKVVGQSLMFSITTHNKNGDLNKRGIMFNFAKTESFSSKIPLSTIFKVAFNISDPEQIQALIGSSSELLTEKYNKQLSDEAIIRQIKHKNIAAGTDLRNKLKTMVTTQTKLESPVRVYDLLGLHNFIGSSLGEELYINGKIYEKNSVLDEDVAFDIEHSGLESVLLLTDDMQKLELTLLPEMYVRTTSEEIGVENISKFKEVESENNTFTFNDTVYSKEGAPTHNTLEMYCIIINRLIAFKTAGVLFSMQDYKNQRIVTFADKIDDFVREDLDKVAAKVAESDNLLQGVSVPEFKKDRAKRLIVNESSALAVVTKNENPLAITSQGRVLVRDVEFLAKEAIQVQAQDLALIDPIDTSESKSIGKSTALTITTEIDDNGVLITPLYKVVNGEVTKEIEKVKVGDLDKLIIAEDGVKLEGNVLARHHGIVKLFNSELVTHVRVSPFSTSSACRGSAVFMENTDLKRLQMAASTQKQARTVLRPSRPRVETGVESIVANGDAASHFIFTVRDVLERNGINSKTAEGHYFELDLLSEEGVSKKFKLTSQEDENLFAIFDVEMEKSSYGSAYYFELVPSEYPDNIYGLDSYVYKQHNIIISDDNSVDTTDRLDYHTKGKKDYFNLTTANGVDLFVMFGFCKSYTVDDASVISDRVVRDMCLSTPVMVTKKFKKGKIFNKEITEEFGKPSGEIIPGYDDKGLPVLGSYLRPGATWIYKYESNSVDGTNTPKNLSLTQNEYGEVVRIENNDLEVRVTLVKWNHVEVGDKFSGREGNKTIISKVMPAEQMPFHPESGRYVDMIINPLSTPSRGNISQLAEMQKGAEVEASGYDSAIVPPFSNELFRMVSDYENDKAHTELQFIDSTTGLYFPEKHFAGYMHYLRNAKISESQIHAIGDSNDIDVAFKQPVGGDSGEKGQSISSMEKELLVSYGAQGILDEVHSILSADLYGFKEVNNLIEEADVDSIDGVEYSGTNFHAEHMQHVALALHASIKQDGENIKIQYMSDKDMEGFQLVDPLALEESLMGRQYLNTMMAIDLGTKILTPVAVKKYSFADIIPVNKYTYKGEITRGNLTTETMEQIIKQNLKIATIDNEKSNVPTFMVAPIDIPQESLERASKNAELNFESGMSAIINILETYPIEIWIKNLEETNPKFLSKDGTFKDDLAKIYNNAKTIARSGGFNRYITTKFPVLPNKYRQSKDEFNDNQSFTYAYRSIVAKAKALNNDQSQLDQLYNMLSSLMLPSDNRRSNQTRISLFDFMTKKDLGGKIRSRILKTRVKLSMRGTIVPMFSGNPEDYGYPSFAGHPDSIGLPLIGAIEIAQPHVVSFLKKNYEYLIEDCSTGIEATSKVIDILTLPTSAAIKLTPWSVEHIHQNVEKLKKELIELITGRYVFYGRAPSLHETSMRGARVYVHNEKVVHLHSLLTTDLNADHDGDQIYIVMPVTSAAIEDIKTKLLPSNNSLRYNDGQPSLAISQDSLLGLYFTTSEPDSDSIKLVDSIEQIKYLLDINDLRINDLVLVNIDGKLVKSTAGRILVNEIVNRFEKEKYVKGESEYYIPLNNEQISGSGDTGISMTELQLEISRKVDSNKDITDIYNDLQTIGYEMCHKRNLTLGIKDLTPTLKVESINKTIKGYIETARTLEELGMLPEDYLIDLSGKVNKLVDELNIMSVVPDDNTFKILAVSGAKGKKSAIERMFSVIGFVDNGKGDKLETPILSNTVKGLSQFQVEDLSYTQRDNAISTVFETSKPGEALRTGAFSLSGLIVTPTEVDNKIPQLVLYSPIYSYRFVIGTDIEDSDYYEGQGDYTYNGEKVTVKLVESIFESGVHQIRLDGIEGLKIFKEPYIKTSLGTSKKDAKYITEDESESYKGEPLTSYYTKQLSKSGLSVITLDSGKKLFIDCKVQDFVYAYLQNRSDLNGLKVSKDELDKMLEETPRYIPLASHTNEFSVEYGITSKHAGYRSGSDVKYREKENIGIKSSTATAQPANQLVISKRNMEQEAGVANGIDLFKSAIQSAKFFGEDMNDRMGPKGYEIAAPEDGIIVYSQNPMQTSFTLYGDSGRIYQHEILAANEHLYDIKVDYNDRVFLGQTIFAPKTAQEERLVSPLRSFVWHTTQIENGEEIISYRDKLINPSTDLIQLIRFYYMIYLESIYRVNKITLDPNHYGAFALQSTRYVKVIESVNKDKGYYNVTKLFSEGYQDNDIVEMIVTKGSETIMLTAGPVAALSYRDANSVISKLSTLDPLPEKGYLGKVALGVSIKEEIPETLLVEQKAKKRKSIVIEDTIVDTVELEDEDSTIDDSDIMDIFGLGEDTDDTAEPIVDTENTVTRTGPIEIDTSAMFGAFEETKENDVRGDENKKVGRHNFESTSLFDGDDEE